MAALVIAALGLIGVLLLLATPSSHHLGSHEPSPCHSVVPWVYHPDDPLFGNERLTSWTREQCALVRQGRATAALVVAVPTVASGALGAYGLLFRRR
ncbi:hypothetical protein [Nocardiopsis sp. FIRDI 009]|uniref:hypothetical protein n=1 Tax=Nocardiopsis sp. FIRDI 009 TaxID=714197 RepID=UPI000E254CC6|nr:hypothetical protein [Nocardiopsis sp. FIRDI 009]